MKRSPLTRKTPLKATTIKASGRRKKSSKPKMTPARKAAKGEDCTVCFPGCPNARETTVLAHLRVYGGGGMGIKPHDSEAVFADDYCHNLLDGRTHLIPELRAEVNWHEYIARALIRTLRRQREKGVLIFKGEEA